LYQCLDAQHPQVQWLKPESLGGAVVWLEGLPSAESAEALVGGDVGALPKVLLHTTVRGGLIGLGLYAAGMRGAKNLVKFGLAGAVGIEVFVLLWAWYEKENK
jgi:hypothetical protein